MREHVAGKERLLRISIDKATVLAVSDGTETKCFGWWKQQNFYVSDEPAHVGDCSWAS